MNKDIENEAIRMYSAGKKTKDILTATGVGSQSTLYRILDRNNIPKRPPKKVKKITISLDKDVMDKVNQENPDNLSQWICDRIRKSYQN
jgi:hypothetical protein